MRKLNFKIKELMVFTIGLFSVINVYSQNNLPNKESLSVENFDNSKVETVPVKTVEYFIDVFNKKGIIAEDKGLKLLSISDMQIIENFNFDNYRNEKTERVLQLVKGPLIKLKPIKDISTYKISKEVIDHKSNEIIDNNQKALITQLDLGLGRVSVDNGELWQSK
jgi:hypothetical protein